MILEKHTKNLKTSPGDLTPTQDKVHQPKAA